MPADATDSTTTQGASDSAREVLTVRVKAAARRLGFGRVGVAPATRPAHWAFYQTWLEKGHAGLMGYLGRNLERRADAGKVLPGAKSAVCVAVNYEPPEPRPDGSGVARGQVARFARGDDYHDALKDRLEALAEAIRAACPGSQTRAYVDTGPILERDLAARAGLGWFGKHTNLIDKRRGSWFFLAEVVTTAELEYDAPVADHCGSCTRCLEACPTGALPEPYLLDSNRCISYLTIELRGAIPRPLRPLMGDWVFGCDVCQEVCPWNLKQAQPTDETPFQPRPESDAPLLRELLALDPEGFSSRFRRSPIKRAKRRGLLRNAAVALGNTGGAADVPALGQALRDDEPLVRAHAAWALGRIGGDRARRLLDDSLRHETEDAVVEEILAAMGSMDSESGN